MKTQRRFFLYSHDGQGLGHARRHLAIARGIVEADPNASVLIATGIEELPKPGLPPNVEVLKMPSLRKMPNGRYESRRLLLAPRETRALRSSLLLTAVKSFRPHVVLADKHPFGASGEFRHALAAARRQGARSALGLRDILDEASTVRREWRPHGLPDAITDHYDEVLIYGERAVFDAVNEYDFPEDLAARSHYCGYVINPPPRVPKQPSQHWSAAVSETSRSNMVTAAAGFQHSRAPVPSEGEPPSTVRTTSNITATRPLVLATAGAGEDGFHVLASFLQASVGAPWDAMAVSGPHCPPEHAIQLAALAAAANAEWHTFVPALETRIASAAAVVCMGGYNTLGEAVASGVPTVCVPRVVPRREQLIRARAFERLGLLQVITPGNLTPEKLRAGLVKALSSTPNTTALDFSGASHSAQRLLALADAAIAQMNGEPAYA